MAEAFCPEHGPYDASLGACPYHGNSGSRRPGPPPSLDDDELPTDPFGAQRPATVRMGRAAPDDDDVETEFPRGGARASFAADDEETEMPRARRGQPIDDDELDKTEIDRPETGLLGWLVVKSGGRYGHMYKIKAGAIIGRDTKKADMILDDTKISGLHAKITVKNGRFMLVDLGSANGTFVNGQELTGGVAISENDEIKMGNLVFVVKTLGETRSIEADQARP